MACGTPVFLAKRVGIDQHALGAVNALAHHQLVLRLADPPLQIEHLAARHAHNLATPVAGFVGSALRCALRNSSLSEIRAN